MKYLKDLGNEEVEMFLNYPTAECKVAAGTSNQTIYYSLSNIFLRLKFSNSEIFI